MTVAELINYLKEFNPGLQIWMAGDGEGNNYSPITPPVLQASFEYDAGLKNPFVEEFSDDDMLENPYVLMIWPGYYVRN